MPADDFDISYVVSVYNKSSMLLHVLDSLSAQKGDFSVEYIFVDDASTDESLKILYAKTTDWPAVTVLKNTANVGPSIRVNQGARQARGRYLCLFDADDVLAPDAMATMMSLLDRHQADLLHGKRCNVDSFLDSYVRKIGPDPRYRISDSPLDTVIGRGFARMTWLARRTVFERASGCDERVFIQDEALRLRLGLHARRFVDLREVVTYASTAGEHLSGNVVQQHHDRFLAYYFFLQDKSSITEKQRWSIYRMCLSAAWKSVREDHISAFKCRVLALYAVCRIRRGLPNDRVLCELAAYFRKRPGVRRLAQGTTHG